MRDRTLVAVFLLASLGVLVAGLYLGWRLYDQISNMTDTTIYVSQKYAHPFTHEYCNPAIEGSTARLCYELTSYSYKVSTGDNKILAVTSKEVYDALAEGGNYQVRLCGKQFLVVCGVFGKEQK